jgi:hypothetical protein
MFCVILFHRSSSVLPIVLVPYVSCLLRRLHLFQRARQKTVYPKKLYSPAREHRFRARRDSHPSNALPASTAKGPQETPQSRSSAPRTGLTISYSIIHPLSTTTAPDATSAPLCRSTPQMHVALYPHHQNMLTRAGTLFNNYCVLLLGLAVGYARRLH